MLALPPTISWVIVALSMGHNTESHVAHGCRDARRCRTSLHGELALSQNMVRNYLRFLDPPRRTEEVKQCIASLKARGIDWPQHSERLSPDGPAEISFAPSTWRVQRAGWIRMGEWDPKVPHKCQELNFWTKLPKSYAGSLNCPSKVSNQSKIWRLAFPIVLIALLIGTTVGVLWHQHATSSPDTCPICHFSHQAIEPALTTARLSVLIATGPAPEPQHLRFTAANSARHVPARAPPA
jgi:hypothetical protein